MNTVNSDTLLFSHIVFHLLFSREVWISGCRLCDYIVKNRLTAEFALIRLKNKYPFFFKEEDDEFAPENVTFAPKDVVPVDFTPKVDSHGLGYRGLNPLQALGGGSESAHINLFTLQSDRTSSLFGDRNLGKQCRGGIAGQVRPKYNP